MNNILTVETARSISMALQGMPAAQIPAPNGDTPEWQRDLVELVKSASNRRAALSLAIDGRPDGLKIYNEVMGAWVERPAVITKPDKPEKQYTSLDYVTVLNQMGYGFRLCDLDDRVEVNGEGLTDVTEAEIRTRVRDLGLGRVNVIRDVYITEAAKHRYHPIRDYLNRLNWDGRDYITELAAHFSDQHNLIDIAFRRWLVGAVAKAFTSSQNRMLVLDGEQGIGKSHFVRWLAAPLMDWFTEGPINPDDKDHQIRLMRSFVWEVSELGSTMRRADVEALKHFLTQRQVTVRVPYGHNDIIKPALASFIGTVNNIGGILNDASGSRRFIAVNITAIDWGYANLPVAQVWAQATQLYRNGQTAEPTPDELTIINAVNSEYEVDDPVEDLIQKFFDVDRTRADWFTASMRVIEVLHREGWKSGSIHADARNIAQACKRLGLKRVQHRPLSGKQVERGYSGLVEKYIPEKD